MITAEVGVTILTGPGALSFAVTTGDRAPPATSASGARIGITSAAWPGRRRPQERDRDVGEEGQDREGASFCRPVNAGTYESRSARSWLAGGPLPSSISPRAVTPSEDTANHPGDSALSRAHALRGRSLVGTTTPRRAWSGTQARRRRSPGSTHSPGREALRPERWSQRSVSIHRTVQWRTRGCRLAPT